MKRFFIAFAFLSALVSPAMVSPVGASDQLLASLDKYLVAIETDFTGESLILFGTFRTNGPLLVTVHGPGESVQIHKKARSFGIWHNSERVTFDEVPGFYFFGHTGEHLPSLDERILQRHQIGVQNIRMIHEGNIINGDAPKDVRPYVDALIRNKMAARTYQEQTMPIQLLGPNLFRVDIPLGAEIPTGTYTVEVMLVEDNQITAAQTIPLFVRKKGLEAQIFSFAHSYPAAHGIGAILIAVIAGISAGWAFRSR